MSIYLSLWVALSFLAFLKGSFIQGGTRATIEVRHFFLRCSSI